MPNSMLDFEELINATNKRTNEQLADEGANTQQQINSSVASAEVTKKSADPYFQDLLELAKVQGEAAKKQVTAKSALDLESLIQAKAISDKTQEAVSQADEASSLILSQVANVTKDLNEYENLIDGKNANGTEGNIFRKLGSFFLGPFYQSQAKESAGKISSLASSLNVVRSTKALSLTNAVQEQELITQGEYERQIKLNEAQEVVDQLGVDNKVASNSIAILKDKYGWDEKSITNFKTQMETNAQLVHGNNVFASNLINWENVQTAGRAQKDQAKHISALKTQIEAFNKLHTTDTKASEMKADVLAPMLARPNGFEEVMKYIGDQDLTNALLTYISTGISSAAGTESTSWGTRQLQLQDTEYTPRDRLFGRQMQEASGTFGITSAGIQSAAIELAGGADVWGTLDAEERNKFTSQAQQDRLNSAYTEKDKKAGYLALATNNVAISELSLSEYLSKEDADLVLKYMDNDVANGEESDPDKFGKSLAYTISQVSKASPKRADAILENVRKLLRDQTENSLKLKFSELYRGDLSNIEFNIERPGGIFGVSQSYNLFNPVEFEEFKLHSRASYISRKKSSFLNFE